MSRIGYGKAAASRPGGAPLEGRLLGLVSGAGTDSDGAIAAQFGDGIPSKPECSEPDSNGRFVCYLPSPHAKARLAEEMRGVRK